MLVKINGTESEIAEKLSIEELISMRNLQIDALIIELNGEIIKREFWQVIQLNHNDCIEIVRLIGGG